MTSPVSRIDVSESQGPYSIIVQLDFFSVTIALVDSLNRIARSTALVPAATPSLPEDFKPEDALKWITESVQELITDSGVDSSAARRIVLVSTGVIDSEAGQFTGDDCVDFFEGFPIRDRLAEACKTPVTMVNTMAAAVHGEFLIGAGQLAKSMVLLSLDDEIYTGLIIDGLGSREAAFGHVIVETSNDARWCCCGQRGHLNAYAGGDAIERRTWEMLDAGLVSTITDRIVEGEELTPELIGEEAEKGDQLAINIVMETAAWLGIGLVTFMHTVDPICILLTGPATFGGADTQIGRDFLARAKQEIDARAFKPLAERIRLEYATLGEDAALIGAAALTE